MSESYPDPVASYISKVFAAVLMMVTLAALLNLFLFLAWLTVQFAEYLR